MFVTNGRFSAHTNAYIGLTTLAETATLLTALKNREVKEFQFSDNVRVRISPADSIGHVDVCTTTLRGTWTSEDFAEILFETSLGEVDEFAAQLIHLESKNIDNAVLRKT